MGIISSSGSAPGKPVVDRQACTLCGICSETCPGGILTQTADAVKVDNDAYLGCLACGQCMMACPSGAIAVTGRNTSPQDLLPLPPKNQRATAEQLEALLLARRSVRHFTKDEIPRATLERVIAAAATAPMGIPPWEVGIVAFHGFDQVRELSKDTVDGYVGMLKFMDHGLARLLLPLLMKKTTVEQFRTFLFPLGRAIVGAWKQGQDAVLYGAPAALLFHHSPYADAADAVIACTYAMIAAESLGLGTTMIGCCPPIVARNKKLLQKYGIPAGHKPAIALILGYSSMKFQKAIRRPFLSVKYR